MTNLTPNHEPHPVVGWAAELADAMLAFTRRVVAEGGTDLVALPDMFQQVVRYACDPYAISGDLTDLDDAWRIVCGGVPVAATIKTNRGARVRWVAPQPAATIVRLAAAADPDTDLPFAATAATNDPHRHGPAGASGAGGVWRPVSCGRLTSKHLPCRNPAIYRPDSHGQPAGGMPCALHATPTETVEVATFYDRAVLQRGCDSCAAAAGTPCRLDPPAAVPVPIPSWARVHSFAGRRVHHTRLVAAAAHESDDGDHNTTV